MMLQKAAHAGAAPADQPDLLRHEVRPLSIQPIIY